MEPRAGAATFAPVDAPSERRLRRLAEEIEEAGVALPEGPAGDLVLHEVDRALRPVVHERRVPSGGAVLDPRTDPTTWGPATDLHIAHTVIGDQPLDAARRFADGMSSWLLRRSDGPDEWLVFDRPAGSERDLGVLAQAFGAVVVQRHPTGAVRVAGPFGVLRWDGFTWHLEPPVDHWLDVVACTNPDGVRVLRDLLEFAVHDLGAAGIGALLVLRPHDEPGPPVEELLPAPPPLRIGRPTHLGPLRHALAQIDGATVFDREGVVRKLGVRLVPSAEAEAEVPPVRGTRHTSGRRYSYDDPHAVVVVVSEDGPVSVFRNGVVLGRSGGPG